MIENFTEGQAKDEILKYCIGQKRGNIASTELQNAIFPNTSVDVVNILLQKIKDDSNGIATINLKYRTKYISTNGATQMFLDEGGFEKKELDSKSASDLSKTKELLELENLKLQKEASEHQRLIRDKDDQIRNLTVDSLRLGNWDIRFRWLIAIITFLIGFIVKYFIDN